MIISILIYISNLQCFLFDAAMRKSPQSPRLRYRTNFSDPISDEISGVVFIKLLVYALVNLTLKFCWV